MSGNKLDVKMLRNLITAEKKNFGKKKFGFVVEREEVGALEKTQQSLQRYEREHELLATNILPNLEELLEINPQDEWITQMVATVKGRIEQIKATQSGGAP